jgi:hypothetical protein
MDMKIIDILNPFLIGRYERLKENFNIIYGDLLVSDLKYFDDYEISDFFSDLLLNAVTPVNKILTNIFIKNNRKKIIDSYNLIISQQDKDQ